MYRLECKPLAMEHIEAAKQIALDNYLEEREYVPQLPEEPDIWDISYFVENGYGVVALEEGRVVGYLCFYHPWSGAFDTKDSLGTFSPLHANGSEYSCAMKSHFRKSGNQMSGKWKSSFTSLLA